MVFAISFPSGPGVVGAYGRLPVSYWWKILDHIWVFS